MYRESREGYVEETLALEILTTGSFFHGISRRDGHFGCNSDRPLRCALYFQGIMPGYSRPRNIQCPDRGDRHSFPLESMLFRKLCRMLDFRKEGADPVNIPSQPFLASQIAD